MEKLIGLYRFILRYKDFLLLLLVVTIFIVLKIIFNQRNKTVDTLTELRNNSLAIIAWQNKKDYRDSVKDYRDSIRDVIINHLPEGQPVSIITRVSSTYTQRKDPISGEWEFHTGIDYQAKKGTPVLAAGAGIVVKSGWNIRGGYGYAMELDHTTTADTVNKFTTFYGHLSKINVVTGEIVSRGDTIGLVGSTGYSTGPHLHYEMTQRKKRINPNFFN
jgi:murein DD-endopeptidase MepM/ murein hydrolase activator NlpD